MIQDENVFEDKISIIVPFHSLEDYLARCLNSIKNQTYKNFEVIMLANNVKDKSIEIANKFAQDDNRFILKQFPYESKNIAKIRNFALQFVTGKYIAWVDGDDWVSPNFLKIQYESIKNNNADISICRVWPNYSGKNKFSKSTKCRKKLLNSEQLKQGILTQMLINGGVTNKLFVAELAKKIEFDEYCSIFEDLEYCLKYADMCKKAVFNNKILYIYFKRRGSLTHTTKATKVLRRLNTMNKLLRAEDGDVQDYKIFARGLHTAICSPLMKNCEKTSYEDKTKVLFAHYLKDALDVSKKIRMPFYKKLYVWFYYKKYKKYLKMPLFFVDDNK